MPNLCQLDDVKAWLQIDNADSDAVLTRLIAAVSADFLNRVNRPGLTPLGDHTETLIIPSWQPETREQDIFLKHYPVQSIASVTINGTDIPEWDPNNPVIPGWFFDEELDDENRQKVTLMCCSFNSLISTWMSPFRSVYRPPEARIVVEYEGGYSDPPPDIVNAVIEWVGYKKGLGDLQAKDQSSQWLQIGQFQQNTSIATSTLKFSGIDLPMSVQSVIDKYTRPIV